jgi:putative transposase
MGYPSDLKEKEWKRIGKYFEPSGIGGRKPKHSKQAIVNAVLYVVKSGCQWRMLPKDFPPWKTVYDHFRRWNLRGVWEQALDELNRQHRVQAKKVLSPATASLTRKAPRLSRPAKKLESMGARK